MKTILITGVADFIGFHVSQALLAQGHTVIGVDNLNDYYYVRLKQARLGGRLPHPQFTFHPIDLADRIATAKLFAQNHIQRVIQLAV